MANISNEKAWDYAIGLVQLDGIKPSDDFLELVEKEKKGELTGENRECYHCDNETRALPSLMGGLPPISSPTCSMPL